MGDRRLVRVARLLLLSLCVAAAAGAHTDPRTTMLARDGWNALSRSETRAATASAASLDRVPLSALRNSFSFDNNEATLACSISARAVRLLINEAGGYALSNLLRDLGAGVELDAAFAHRIQKSYADFAASLSSGQP